MTEPFCEQAPTVVGYVFGALEPEEEAAVTEHLADCADCRAVRDDAETVAVAMGRSVPQLDPPPELRTRVLAAARAEPEPPRRAAPPPPPPAPGSPGSLDGPPVRDDEADAGPRGRRTLLALAVAATLGVILLVGGAVVSTQSGPGAQDPTSQAARAQRIVENVTAREPGTPHATVRSGDGQPVAVVVAERYGPRVVPVAMTDPGQGHQYLLWAAGSGAAAVPVATIDPTAGTTLALPGAASPSPPRAYAISVEPAGPAPARPSAVVGVGVVAT